MHPPLVAAVNDDVAGLHELHQSLDRLVDGGAGLDEDDDAPVQGAWQLDQAGVVGWEETLSEGPFPRQLHGAFFQYLGLCRDITKSLTSSKPRSFSPRPETWVRVHSGQERGQALQ